MRVSASQGEEQGIRRCTLLELVQDVTAGTASDAECVAVVRALLESGRAVLTGNFRGESLS